jgi:molybdopterin/thiamine biosynthesis adenylyltransferase
MSDRWSLEERYSRQILFQGIGREGQQRLQAGRVVILGCGALGCTQAEMLARAGVGWIRLIDRDLVEPTNLHRQVLFEERDADERLPKAVAAAARLAKINRSVVVDPLVRDVNAANIEALVEGADVVLDGTDNFETRYLLNDVSIKHGRPWIYGAAVGAHGLQMTIRPGETPCLRCLFPEMPAPGTTPTCDTAGVILPIISVVASHQVVECLKLLLGEIDRLHGCLLQFDLWENRTSRLRLDRLREDATCPTCHLHRYDSLQVDRGQLVTTLCGRNAIQISPPLSPPLLLDLAERANQLRNVGQVRYNAHLLKFQTGEYELTVFPDGRCLIHGTEDPNVARSLYARYLGL